MRFIILVIDDQTEPAGSDEMAAIDAFNEMLERDGNWVTAAGINHGQAALVIDNRDDRNEAIKGSLQTGVEHYSGFWLITAPSAEKAQELALAGSKACNRKVELRPYLGA